MQKKIIVLAIAAAFAAPAFADTANVNVYGSLNLAVEAINVGNDATGAKNGYDVNKISSNATRLGLKGTKELKNGLSAIWQIEQQIDTANNPLYYQHDQYGSTRLLTNQAGTVAATFTYNAHGTLTARTGTADTPLRWNGQYQDSDTDLYYLRARYYDPTTAQFLTRDPLEDQTRSAYGYGGNDPINAADPSGELAWFVVLAIMAATSASSELGTQVLDNKLNGCDAFDNIDRGSIGFSTAMGLVPFGGPAAIAGRTAAKTLLGSGDTVLYQKLGSAGEHLKYGITKNPATRYTSKELDGGSLNILTRGPKKDMLALERSLHKTLPIGPQEGQLFYIQQQIANGLRPPPYPW